MSISTVVTMFDPTASPQTGVADGDSQAIWVGPRQSNRGGADILYPIVFAGNLVSGTGTFTPSLCTDPQESPRRWIAVSKMQDDGTDVAVTRAADFNMVMDVPAESLVKWTISSASSVQFHLTATGVCR